MGYVGSSHDFAILKKEFFQNLIGLKAVEF